MKFVAVSISKVLLEHSYAHLFIYVPSVVASVLYYRVEQLPQRPCVLQNQNFYSGLLQKKFPFL